MTLRLTRPQRPRPPLAGATRWLVRGFLLVAIVLLAHLQGLGGSQLLALGLAIAWALLLPLLVQRVWRATAGRSRRSRILLTGACALFFLVVFALVVGASLR